MGAPGEGGNGFSARYRTTSLVFFEMTGDARSAIAREKQLKNWRREKKIALIERHSLPIDEAATEGGNGALAGRLLLTTAVIALLASARNSKE